MLTTVIPLSEHGDVLGTGQIRYGGTREQQRRILMRSEEPTSLSPTTTDVDYGPQFTPREVSILQLVAVGCTNVQIGEKLHISKYTVAQHIAKMLLRSGAANRTDLVSRAHIVGIL